jgi:4-hydroxy-2-oxoheptanedioate aldolase
MRWIIAVSAVSVWVQPRTVGAQAHQNPVIDLLAAHKPVFGVYAPANRRGGRGGQPALPPDSVKSAATLGGEAVAYTKADYIFDGSMEGNFDAGYSNFSEFVKGMSAAGMIQGKRLTHPLFVKTPEIAPDAAKAGERIARQLNLGVAGVVFVGVESADEVKNGLAMMRFKSKGGTRPDDVGDAPARWGLSEKDYKEKADLWPLNPKGELVNFTIVESKEGLAHVREIAAVKGIGVLLPGAGTLRQVFSAPDASGQRKLDEAAWEAAIQQVLAACKEFKVPCGYPATANDIEARMAQGFSVFVINWGDAGFKAVDIGRTAGKR